MGGKKQQAQRTKNRVKPSSSGRTAELLGNQYSTFSGFKETGCIMPTFSLPPTEDIELKLDTDFQLVFKKMVKKDSTTKLKALSEFTSLVKNSDAEAVKTVLPFWPRLFNLLAIDTEHKVREATFVAHNEVVQKVRRNLAPYLKQIIAAWFVSQYDTYPPAATAATQSFNNAFPEKKCEEAITFCSQEIINHIHDNLLIQTPQTVCDQKHNSKEESEAKFERVLTSSLHGYSLFLNRINKLEELKEINKRIVGSGKFWKYSKHDSAVVRVAWFELLTAMFKKAPFLLESEEGHILNATVGSIDEADPVVLPLVWQNVLLALTSIKEWWTKVNIEKLMLPKLWKMLKDGGQGNASVIYPNLLPLVSSLLPIIVDIHIFSRNFFHNLYLGLKQKSVVSSKSESTAISTTLIECLQYIVMINENNIELCEELIKVHLFQTIEWCFKETQSCYKSVFNQTAALVQYWSRNSTSEHPNYSIYLMSFWINADILVQKILSDVASDPEQIITVSERQIEFLQSLKNAAKSKKKGKVKFDSEEKADNVSLSPSILPDESFLISLDNLIYKIFETFIKLLEDKNLKQLFDHLIALIPQSKAEIFFGNFSKRMEWDESNGITAFFQNFLLKWMKCEKLRCKSLIALIFLIFKHANDGEKQLIMDYIDEFTKSDKECFLWCFEEGLSYQHNKDVFIRKWLKSDKVSMKLAEYIKGEILNEDLLCFTPLLKMATVENEDGEFYISDDAITSISLSLKKSLDIPEDYLNTIDNTASIAAQLSTVLYNEKLLLTFGDSLLLSLIQLSCSDIDSDYLSADTLWEVQTAWQDALGTIFEGEPEEKIELLLKKIINIIHCVENSQQPVIINLEKIEKYAEILSNVCRTICKATPTKIEKYFEILFYHSFVLDWKTKLSDTCNFAAYLNGSLTSCYENFEFESNLQADEMNFLNFFALIYLKVCTLTADLENYEDEDVEEDCDDEEVEKNSKIWNSIPNKIDLLADLLYENELLKCFIEEYPTATAALKIEEFKDKIIEKCSEIATIMSKEDKQDLKELLKRKCYSDSWIWCKIIPNATINFLSDEPTEIYEDFVKNATENDKLTILHLTQSFLKYLNFDYVTPTFDDISRILILRSLIQCKEIDVQIAEVMSILEKIRNDDIDRFNCKSFDIDWTTYQIILETARLLNVLIKYQWESLSRRYIDLIIISLAEWLSRVATFCKIPKVLPMMITIINLYHTIIEKVKELKSQNIESALTKEWDDLFAEGLQNDFAKLWLNISSDSRLNISAESWPITSLPIIYAFALMSKCLDYQLIFKSFNGDPPNSSKFIKQSLSLLTSFNTSLQISGYKTLLTLIPGLVKEDSDSIENGKPADKGLAITLFEKDCLKLQETMSNSLRILKTNEMVADKDAGHTINKTLAYLLIWDVLLNLCENSVNSLKYEYSEWIRNKELLKELFNNILTLMPDEVLHFSDHKKLLYIDWFTSRLPLDSRDSITEVKLDRMACWIYYFSHSQLPALVRHWWSGAETKISQICERLTSTFVSPQLCSVELEHVKSHEKKFKNMTIKVIPSVKEVVATYTVDDAQMDLVITLPTNYPLVGPEVHCQRQIGKNPHKVWLMEFRKCLLHQNGGIWNGLKSWNSNLDKKFDGIEECYICFSILHPGTYQLPKLTCQTCKKKFHSACLYKWFSTSNKSSCPICRNLF